MTLENRNRYAERVAHLGYERTVISTLVNFEDRWEIEEQRRKEVTPRERDTAWPIG